MNFFQTFSQQPVLHLLKGSNSCAIHMDLDCHIYVTVLKSQFFLCDSSLKSANGIVESGLNVL